MTETRTGLRSLVLTALLASSTLLCSEGAAQPPPSPMGAPFEAPPSSTSARP